MHKKGITYITVALAAALAFYLSNIIPLLGRSLLAIVIGMILRYTPVFDKLDGPSLKFIRGHILKFGIVLLGFDLSLQVLSGVGLQSLPYILIYISLVFIFALLFGRVMNVPSRTSFLIGTGSAICGGSAVMTVGPLLEVEDEELTYAMSTIVVSNLVALIVFPVIGSALNMTETQFGLFTGTTIKDVATVVAVGFDFSAAAGEIATIVKLTRVLMLVLVVIGVTIYNSQKQSQTVGESNQRVSIVSSIPRFVIWFIAVIALVSLVQVPETIVEGAGTLSSIALTSALVCIGLNTDFKSILKNGLKPVVLGEVSWYAASIIVLTIILFFAS